MSFPRTRVLHNLLGLSLLVSALAGAAGNPSPSLAAGPLAKRVCVKPTSVSDLATFNRLVGRDVNCLLSFNDAAPDWSSWERPWMLIHGNPDLNFGKWAAAVPGRQLVITQNMFPSSENKADWRHAGARGDYVEHAQALARNLVSYGQADAIIRLGHEANGTWYPDSVGDTPAEYRLWVQFWRRTVLAMKSVPGANFKFDWTVNAGYRPIPLDQWYPGDDVVDIIGCDAYDSGFAKVPAGADRWTQIYNQPSGLKAVRDYAKAHGKPLSIPEWGVAPRDTLTSAGDDPTYVDGIADVVRHSNVAYQSYFYAHGWATQLARGPKSLASYRRHFGPAGDAVPGAETARRARATRHETTRSVFVDQLPGELASAFSSR